MMNFRIYHVNFSRSIDTVVWEYTTLNETDRLNLTQITFESSFDYEDNLGMYNMLIIAEGEQFSKYKNILDNNMIYHHSHEVSRSLLENKFELNKIEKLVKPSLQKLYKNFLDKIEVWILENNDIDIVLDLINEFGIENIRDIDKKFLDNYANKQKNSSILR